MDRETAITRALGAFWREVETLYPQSFYQALDAETFNQLREAAAAAVEMRVNPKPEGPVLEIEHYENGEYTGVTRRVPVTPAELRPVHNPRGPIPIPPRPTPHDHERLSDLLSIKTRQGHEYRVSQTTAPVLFEAWRAWVDLQQQSKAEPHNWAHVITAAIESLRSRPDHYRSDTVTDVSAI